MCLFPGKAILDPEGGRPKFHPDGDLKLPCGKCDECLKLRASSWGLRARHEISQHSENCFLTLTYDDSNLPSPQCMKRPFQLFLKKLRAHTGKKLNYMVSHEYGSKTFRPHHHAIIFGFSPNKQSFLRNAPSGSPLFTSPDISKLWGLGYHSIGEANEKTAYYIAAYALKGKKHDYVDSSTGEHITLSDSFDCSKRPGIGLSYFNLHYKQLVDSGTILPRYYLKKLKEQHPDLYEKYENNQISNFTNRTPSQIIAKMEISHAKKSLGDSEYRTAPDSSEHQKLSKALKYSNNNFLLGVKK